MPGSFLGTLNATLSEAKNKQTQNACDCHKGKSGAMEVQSDGREERKVGALLDKVVRDSVYHYNKYPQ